MKNKIQNEKSHLKFDILFVTYNSSEWINQCISSIVNTDYNLKNITLIFHDNNSNDNTIELLLENKNKYKNVFNDFIIDKGKKNVGFGVANNLAFKLGKSEYIFIYNVDTKMHSDTLKLLEEEILKSDSSVGMWELCQCPYEHPKYYDPVTQYVDWASGACMITKRSIFEKIGGFDKNIFMYCEDVDISWNVRRHGYNIKYLYNVEIDHFSYKDGQDTFKYNQFLYSYIGNWYLRTKYCSFKKFLGGLIEMSRVFRGLYIPDTLDINIKNKIKRESFKFTLNHFIKYLFINLFNKSRKSNFVPNIRGCEIGINGVGAFEVFEKAKTKPLVSIIVRTCGRPNVLRETLISLKKQTYTNFEVVIVEDGPNISEEMIKNEFCDMNINYYSTNINKGRSNAGNLGMELSNGKYLNFLDDDDVFFPKHIETMVDFLENNNIDIAYASSYETKIDVVSNEPYIYKINDIGVLYVSKFSKLNLYKNNFIPIQSIMFNKKVYLENGGFDVNIEYLEDWDLWVRYSLKNDFGVINKTTSAFRTPYNKRDYINRKKTMDTTIEYLENKWKGYNPILSVKDYNNRY